jgi:K+-transporting ATPase ATPase C chain
MKTLVVSLKVLLIFTVLTGIVYPLLITGIAQLVFPWKANGSLIKSDGKTVGSELIGQTFDSCIYFSGRPSESSYDATHSGGSNSGITSKSMSDNYERRKSDFLINNRLNNDSPVPSEMLFASASGLDPHISVEAALLQAQRVSKARHFSKNQEEQLFRIIKDCTERPQFYIFGNERVNVLLLNLKINSIK